MRRFGFLRCASLTLEVPLGDKVKVIAVEDKPLPPLPSTVSITVDDALEMIREMSTIRFFESQCAQFYTEKKVRGFLHLQVGQEAIPVGAVKAMEKCDTYSGSYRIHGWHYMLTKNIESTIGEVLGKVCGTSKGKGGSMHLYAPNEGLYGGQGIVGAQVPIAAGLAFASKHMREVPSFASVAMFGDGALNQGQVAETWNLAALYKLPVIFCLEDNKYSMGTADHRGSAETVLAKRVPYIVNLQVDGMDVLATYAAMRYARKYVMSGRGPVCVHFDTYRYVPHSASDKGAYRTDAEVKKVKRERDPIETLKGQILSFAPDYARKIEDVEKAADKAVDAAAAAIVDSPQPPMSELTTDVLDGPRIPIRSCQSTKYI